MLSPNPGICIIIVEHIIKAWKEHAFLRFLLTKIDLIFAKISNESNRVESFF
jgi:hypothetical protein